jgi:hypothetical protein
MTCKLAEASRERAGYAKTVVEAVLGNLDSTGYPRRLVSTPFVSVAVGSQRFA